MSSFCDVGADTASKIHLFQVSFPTFPTLFSHHSLLTLFPLPYLLLFSQQVTFYFLIMPLSTLSYLNTLL